MFDRFVRVYRRFRAAPSGTRFQEHHERMRSRPSLMRTVLAVGVGLILLAAGLAMLVLPGPGLLIGALGAALIAGESRFVACVLDRVDAWMTARWRRLRR